MLHLRIFHGSRTTSFCFPFALPPALTRTICEYTSRASGPETRITPIPPRPGGVDNAYIVFFSVGDGTTLVTKRLPCHSFRIAALREDSIIAGPSEVESTERRWVSTRGNWIIFLWQVFDREIQFWVSSPYPMPRIRKSTRLERDYLAYLTERDLQRLASERIFTSARG